MSYFYVFEKPTTKKGHKDIRKIFKLRGVVDGSTLDKAHNIMDNGGRTFLWLDDWHPFGRLFSRFGDRIVFILGRVPSC